MISKTKFRQFMIILASVISIVYLFYRLFFTLNFVTTYATFASLLLFVAEVYGVTNLLLYFLQVWEPREPKPQPPLENCSVDVLVTTYNEDPAMLRATLEACVRMDYPHQTYVLDDGKRPEVEALARELGCHYVIRPDNRHAKAGNLNHALERTNGEFVVVFDADHVPEPNFITRLIGHFRDEQLAFVQTPHAFYNFDSFQARLNHKARKYWDEGSMFYKVVQPGRNRWNCPIFAGSAVMFRRVALQDVGYVATETITEDMHTGLRMHAKGWKSLAISERLVAGQAAPDITTFHNQRLRWAEGNLSVMAWDNPLTMKGLTLAQRACYFGTIIHWASGLFKLALYLTPILMLFTGVSPVNEFTWPLMVMMSLYIFFSFAGYKVAGNGHASIVNSELFSMVTFWTSIRATFRAMFRRRFSKFIVTSKRGRQSKSIWPFIQPHIVLAVLCLLALGWGWARVISGISDDPYKPIVPSIWVLLHMFLIYLTTHRAFWPEDRRFGTRHVVHLPVMYELMPIDPDGPRFGVTADLNDAGIGFVAYEVLPPNAVLRIVIRGAGQFIECEAKVRTAKPLAGGGTMHGYRYGCELRNLSPEDIDHINRICLHYAVPKLYSQYEVGNRNTFWNRILTWRERGMAQRRTASRYPYTLPAVIYRYGTRSDGSAFEPMHTATEDLSKNAFVVLLDEPLPLGTQIGYYMQSPLGEMRGYANVLRYEVREFATRRYFRVILEFGEFEGQGRTTLLSLVNPREAGDFGPILSPDKRPQPVRMARPILLATLIAMPLLLIQTGVFRYGIHRDDFFLQQIVNAPSNSITPEQQERLDRIYTASWQDNYPSTDRLVLLMSALHSAGRDREMDEITKRLAPRDRKNTDLQLALAQSLDDTEEYAQAEIEYQRLLDLAAKGQLPAEKQRDLKLAAARSFVHSASTTSDSARYDKAFDLFRELVREFPNDHALRNEFAGTLISANKFQEARQLYANVEPDIDGRKRLIAAYALEKNYELAATEARTLLRIQPKDADGEMLLAGIMQAQKSYAMARAIYERLQTAHPNDLTLQRKLAENDLGTRQYDAAFDRYSRLLEWGESDRKFIAGYIDAASSASESKLMAGRAGIVSLFDRVTKSPGEDPVFLARFAWVLQRLGENDKSATIMQKAIALKPNDPEMNKQFLGVLIASGQFESALNLMGSDGNRIEVRKLNLTIHLRNKKYELAEKECRQILESEPNDFQTKLLLADILSWPWKRDFTQSMSIYQELLAAQPSNKLVQSRIAQLALWSDDYPLAVKRLETVLDKSLDDLKPAVIDQLWQDYIDACAGVASLTENQAKLARKAIDRKPFLQSTDPSRLSRLATVLFNANEPDSANTVLDRAVKLPVTDSKARNDLATVLSRAKRYREAVAILENEVPTTNAERVRLAELYAQAFNFTKSAELIASVLNTDPSNHTAMRVQSDILNWKRDYRNALDTLEKLLEQDPKNRDLAARIAEVTLWSAGVDSSAYDRALLRFTALLANDFEQPKLWPLWSDAAANARALTPIHEPLARRIAERVMPSDNKDVIFHARLASVLVRINEVAKANSIVERAYRSKPTDPRLKKELAGALVTVKRYREALAMYDGLTIEYQDRRAFIDTALFAMDFDAAAREAQKLVEDNPEGTKSRRLLTDVLNWKHEADSVLFALKEFLATSPTDSELMIALGGVIAWSEQFPEVYQRYRILHASIDQPNEWDAFIDAASHIATLTDDQKQLALQLFDKDASDALRSARLGWILYKLSETAKVDELLDHAMSLQPSEPSVRREIASVLASRSRYAEAKQMFEGAELPVPPRIDLSNPLTVASQFVEVEATLRSLLKQQPDDRELQTQLADVLMWNGKYAESLPIYQRLASEFPEDAKLSTKLVFAQLWSGHSDDALERFGFLTKRDPSVQRWWKGYIEAATFASDDRLSSHRDAILELAKTVPQKVNDASLVARLGSVVGRLGDHVQANALIREALKREPNSRTIKLQLAESYYRMGEYAQAERIFRELMASSDAAVPMR